VIVVDTNVIAYLVIPGTQTVFAERVLLFDPEWAAPMLWRSEMRNLLSLYLRRGEMSVADAKRLFHRAETTIAGNEYNVDTGRVLELANASGCTGYDCEFVALAKSLDVPLITSDKKLLAAFGDTAVPLSAFAE